jgi:hypothetical protein
VSTLKRWMEDPSVQIVEQRNCNGWRLFSETDLAALHSYKIRLKKNGKQFKDTVLIPVIQNDPRVDSLVAFREGRA